MSLDAGDRPAERMVMEVTQPVEEAVRSVPGVRSFVRRPAAAMPNCRSTSNGPGHGRRRPADGVGDQSDPRSSPRGNEVRRAPHGSDGVSRARLQSDFRYAFTGGTTDIALYQIRPVLSTVPGVARVGVLGGRDGRVPGDRGSGKTRFVWADRRGCRRALSAANVISAVGRMEDRTTLPDLSDTQFADLDQIGNVIRSGENGLVCSRTSRPSATGRSPQWTRVTADGHDAVLFQVYQQPGGNTVAIAAQLVRPLAELQKRLPPDVRIANWYDQSELIVPRPAASATPS